MDLCWQSNFIKIVVHWNSLSSIFKYLWRYIHFLLWWTKEVYTHSHSLSSVHFPVSPPDSSGLGHIHSWKIKRMHYSNTTFLGKWIIHENEVKWSEVAKLCPTLCDSMDCSILCSSVHGIFQARVLEWVAISFSRGSSWPRDRIQVSCTVGGRFTIWAKEKTFYRINWFEKEIYLKAMLAGITESVIFLRRNYLAAFHPVFIFLFKQSYILTVALIYHFYCMNHWVKCLKFRDIRGNVYSSML